MLADDQNAAHPGRRRRLQFSLFALFGLVTLSGIVFAVLARPAETFLGVPVDEEQKGIFGITTMTKVETSDYASYLKAKKQGDVVAEERRGDYTYYAIGNVRHAGDAYVDIVERYKAKRPRRR